MKNKIIKLISLVMMGVMILGNSVFAYEGLGEFQVNTYTNDIQSNSKISYLNGGGFVIVWSSDNQDVDGNNNPTRGIYGQRFDLNGNPLGTEFRVNQTLEFHQNNPDVVALSNGGFAVVWNSNGQDGSSGGIYAKIYDSTGNVVVDEFIVNNTTLNDQAYPHIASLDNGDFVISWNSFTTGVGYQVNAKIYEADGDIVVNEFLVNDTASAFQHSHVTGIVGLDNGNFVLTWELGDGIYAKIYDPNGNVVINQFQVNTVIMGGTQYYPSIANVDNGFVISWSSGSHNNLYAKRYDSNGNALGDEFQVNTTGGTGIPSEWYSTVTELSNGGFVIMWNSNTGIDGQRFDSNGNPSGVEFNFAELYTFSAIPNATSLSNGDFVVTWAFNEVYAEIFSSNFNNGNNAPGIPEFSTYIYLTTLAFIFAIGYRRMPEFIKNEK